MAIRAGAVATRAGVVGYELGQWGHELRPELSTQSFSTPITVVITLIKDNPSIKLKTRVITTCTTCIVATVVMKFTAIDGPGTIQNQNGGKSIPYIFITLLHISKPGFLKPIEVELFLCHNG
jgi:hypothetical protein